MNPPLAQLWAVPHPSLVAPSRHARQTLVHEPSPPPLQLPPSVPRRAAPPPLRTPAGLPDLTGRVVSFRLLCALRRYGAQGNHGYMDMGGEDNDV